MVFPVLLPQSPRARRASLAPSGGSAGGGATTPSPRRQSLGAASPTTATELFARHGYLRTPSPPPRGLPPSYASPPPPQQQQFGSSGGAWHASCSILNACPPPPGERRGGGGVPPATAAPVDRRQSLGAAARPATKQYSSTSHYGYDRRYSVGPPRPADRQQQLWDNMAGPVRQRRQGEELLHLRGQVCYDNIEPVPVTGIGIMHFTGSLASRY